MPLRAYEDQARFCPRCGAAEPHLHPPGHVTCRACGMRVYFNPKPVAAVLLREDDGRIWLLRRGFEPAVGRWTIPGGFVDLGESVEQAAHRETMEELRVECELGPLLGVYSRPGDVHILVVFHGRPLGTPRATQEAPEVRLFAPAELPWEDIAFWSTAAALRDAGR